LPSDGGHKDWRAERAEEAQDALIYTCFEELQRKARSQ
jgi:hypothetical protein